MPILSSTHLFLSKPFFFLISIFLRPTSSYQNPFFFLYQSLDLFSPGDVHRVTWSVPPASSTKWEKVWAPFSLFLELSFLLFFFFLLHNLLVFPQAREEQEVTGLRVNSMGNTSFKNTSRKVVHKWSSFQAQIFWKIFKNHLWLQKKYFYDPRNRLNCSYF